MKFNQTEYSRRISVKEVPGYEHDKLEIFVTYTSDDIPDGAKGVAIDSHIMPLLSTAPEVLDVLEEMLAGQDSMNEPYRNEAICERARAIIKRAKPR